jgi:hypothetical protein
LKKKTSVKNKGNPDKKKSKSVATNGITSAPTKNKSKTTPHFKFKLDTEANTQKRHQEALKAGFQNAEDYETFLKQIKPKQSLKTSRIAIG